MPLSRPRTLSEALQHKPHKHKWKDWTDGAKFCVVCGMPIVKATVEASPDCNHSWSETQSHEAICVKCGYKARDSNYRRWFRKFASWPDQYRPKCLVCREPVYREGTICGNCESTVPNVVF